MVPSPTNDAGRPVDGVAPVDTPNTPNSQGTGKVSCAWCGEEWEPADPRYPFRFCSQECWLSDGASL